MASTILTLIICFSIVSLLLGIGCVFFGSLVALGDSIQPDGNVGSGDTRLADFGVILTAISAIALFAGILGKTVEKMFPSKNDKGRNGDAE